MRIYSDYPELRGKEFNSVDACKEAETKIDAERVAKAEKAAQADAEKQVYIDKINAAKEKLANARTALNDAQKSAREIEDEAYAKIRSVIEPAQADVVSARSDLSAAVGEYNQKFGPYRETIKLGDQNRCSIIDDIMGDFFRSFWLR